ncbi:hypothetical protein H8K47_15305 [Undibacterium sp. CY7W]|uniref:DUF2059 domain-containing protein n=1 Tax=Undibacterium rugosum TaxID=2762291 RepID=A0A923I2T1_9BURK|nr:hypothetical protein [Undibacterium rugosum]MBC3936734.1 hypothetical protein [Undibacterium rugosum]
MKLIEKNWSVSSLSRRLPCKFLYVLAVCSFLQSAHVNASEATTRIARYFDAPGRAVYGAHQMVQELRNQRPDEAKAIDKSLTYFDADVFSAKVGTLLDRYLTVEDVRQTTQFMATPSGKLVENVFKRYKDPVALASAMNNFPPEDKRTSERFFNSQSTLKILKIMQSREAQEIWLQYGEDLMCAYFAKNDTNLLRSVQRKGKCLSENANN